MRQQNHFRITYTSAGGGRVGVLEATAPWAERMQLQTPAVVPGINIVGGPPGPDRNGGIWRAVKWWMFLEQQVPAFQCNILHPLDVGQLSPTWSGWRARPFVRWISDWQRQKEYPILDNNRPDNGYPFRTIMNWWDFWQQPPGQRSRPPILFSESAGHALAREELLEKCEVKFGLPVSQSGILDLQLEMGADVVMSLDYPLTGGLEPEEVKARRTNSIRNGLELLTQLAGRNECAMPFIAVHGTDREDTEAYIAEFMDGWEALPVDARAIPFGLALGSLHAKASQPGKLLGIMSGVRAAMHRVTSELGTALPIHVLGISSRIMAILVYLGADSFSSQSYIDAARRGRYLNRHLRPINISDIDDEALADCGCFICSQLSQQGFLPLMKTALAAKSRNQPDGASANKLGVGRYYWKTATGEDYTNSDLWGLLAMHNWVQVSREMERIQVAVKQDCLPEYIWEMLRDGPQNPQLLRAVEMLAEADALTGDPRLKEARGKASPVAPGVPVAVKTTLSASPDPPAGRDVLLLVGAKQCSVVQAELGTALAGLPVQTRVHVLAISSAPSPIDQASVINANDMTAEQGLPVQLLTDYIGRYHAYYRHIFAVGQDDSWRTVAANALAAVGIVVEAVEGDRLVRRLKRLPDRPTNVQLTLF